MNTHEVIGKTIIDIYSTLTTHTHTCCIILYSLWVLFITGVVQQWVTVSYYSSVGPNSILVHGYFILDRQPNSYYHRRAQCFHDVKCTTNNYVFICTAWIQKPTSNS